MGKTIGGILEERNHSFLAVDTPEERHNVNREEIDVAIEFSMPEAAVENIKWCISHQIPVVSGTTGWLDQMEQIKSYCTQENGTFFYASNYSIGVNLFFQLNKKFAAVMDRFEQYDVSMEEIHHTQKLDSPSGTALSLANDIISLNSRKNGWVENLSEKGKLSITAKREENVPGTHSITYTSENDSITLEHVAFNRMGFASGAVAVAEWIVDKKGNLTMQDFLGTLL